MNSQYEPRVTGGLNERESSAKRTIQLTNWPACGPGTHLRRSLKRSTASIGVQVFETIEVFEHRRNLRNARGLPKTLGLVCGRESGPSGPRHWFNILEL